VIATRHREPGGNFDRTGFYTVTFNRDVTGCAWLATFADSPSSQVDGVGSILIELLDNPTLSISTISTYPAPFDTPFHLAVFCP